MRNLNAANEQAMHQTAVRVICCLLMVCLLAGCSSTSIIGDKSSVMRLGEEAEKKVVIWHTYSDEETILFEKEVIPEFEAAYPGIKIESFRQTHNQEYHAALMARASAGKTPDIIRMDYTWIPLFVERRLLQPLNDFSQFSEVRNRLQERMLQMNTYDGVTFGLPLNISTKAAIFNNRLLQQGGLSKPPETFAELVKFARSNGYILGMNGIELWNSLPYFMALGGQLADEPFTRTAGYLDSDASIAAMKQLLALYKEGIINPYMFSNHTDLWKEVFSQGKVVMIDEGQWYYSILLNTSSVEEDLLEKTTPRPFPSRAGAGSIIGGESLVITKGARNKDEAWIFMNWMTKRETQLQLFKAGVIPANTEAFAEGRAQQGGVNRYLSAYMEGLEQAFYRPSIPQWNDIEQLYDAAMEDIFMKGKDVEQTLQETTKLIDSLLAGTGTE
jgi:multiple sugar transport system substrate-binding protein